MVQRLWNLIRRAVSALEPRVFKQARLSKTLAAELARAEEEIKMLQLNLIQTIRLNRKTTEKQKIKHNSTLDRVNLPEVVEDCLSHLRPFFESKKIKITAETHAPNLYVMGHKHHLEEVLMCILMNAIDAVEKSQPPIIDVQIHQENNKAIVSIKDTGAGIPKEEHEKVFSPFFTTKPVISSDRIGLSISQLVIQQYGGKISFTSAPGEGSAFYVSLPCCPPETARPSATQQTSVS